MMTAIPTLLISDYRKNTEIFGFRMVALKPEITIMACQWL
jgi:hypothetical protein